MADTTEVESDSKATAEKEVYDRDDTPPSDVEKKLISQCEFYFSDSNLPRDKFLRECTRQGNGWVALATIANFKKIQDIAGTSLSPEERTKLLVSALRKSTSNLLVVSKDDMLKRTTAVPENVAHVAIKRSIFVENLPTSLSVAKGNAGIIDEVKSFFTGLGATVRSVRVRRQGRGADAAFSGTAVVELKDEDEAKAYIEKGVQGSLHWPGQEANLTATSWGSWLDSNKKRKETGEKRKKKPDQQLEKVPEGKWVKLADQVPEFKADRIILIEGLAAQEDADKEEVSREMIKALLEQQEEAKVGYIDYSKGNSTAHVRLEDYSTHGAEALVKIFQEKEAVLAGRKCTFKALAGEEEIEYQKTVAADRRSRCEKKGKGKRGRPSKKQRV